MNSVQLYPISREATQWRDLDSKSKYKELLIKISLVVGIILTVALSVLGAVFLFREAIYLARVPTSIMDVTMGAAFSAATIVGLSLLFKKFNFEEINNGKVENFTDINVHNTAVNFLTTKEIEAIYARYYQKKGGLGGLVRKGYMLPEQGDTLRVLLKEYEEQQKIAWSYAAEFRVSQAIQENRHPAVYDQVRQRMKELNEAWLDIRQKIRNQYHRDAKWANAPQSILSSNAPQILPTPKLMRPTKAASRWRDMSASELCNENVLRIERIVCFIFFSSISICALYFLVSHLFYTHALDLSSTVLTPFDTVTLIAFPTAVLASIIIMNTFITGYMCKLPFFEWEFELKKHGANEPLTKPCVRDDRVLLLTEKNLEEVYGWYYKKHGGLGPLVRKGYLTIEQGKRLSTLFKNFNETHQVYTAYTSTTDLFIQDILDRSENYPAFGALLVRKEKLEKKWRVLQEQIKKNF